VAVLSGGMDQRDAGVAGDRVLWALVERIARPYRWIQLTGDLCGESSASTVPTGSESAWAEATAREAEAFYRSILPRGGEPWSAESFGAGALGRAIAAQALGAAGKFDLRAHIVFAGGLWYRCGQAALGAVFPKGYARVISLAPRSAGGVREAEVRVFGVDHVEIGRRLAAEWGLPSVIEQIIAGDPAAGANPGGLSANPVNREFAAGDVNRCAGRCVAQADAIVRRQRLGWPDFTPIASVDIDVADASGRPLAEQVAELRARIAQAESSAGDAPCAGNESGWGRLAGELQTLFAEAPARNLSEAARRVGASAGRLVTGPAGVVAIAGGRAIYSRADAHRGSAARAFNLTAEMRAAWSVLSTTAQHAVLIDDSAHREARAALPDFVLRALDRPYRLMLLPHRDQLVGAVAFPATALSEFAQWPAAGLRLLAAAYARMLVECDTPVSRAAPANGAGGRAMQTRVLANLAAGAAHELNNPLAVISGRAQMLRRETHDDALLRELAIIEENSRRASAIVAELLACAKPATPAAETLPLAEWLTRVCQHWEARHADHTGRIAVEISDPGLTVHADPQQLTAVLEAVLRNAFDACPPPTARVTINSFSRPSDDTIVVSIADNGRGIAPRILEQVADPFFSHRPAGRGRGLGLSQAVGLMENNGGRLWIDTADQQGATVHLALPARAAARM
jgi:signal transduction histidine kinase